ncbi:hypothetical protein WLU64_00875, partial [Bordetella bronchiseptica]
MGKLIFWFVVILAVLFIARLAGARAASKRAPRAEPPRPAQDAAAPGASGFRVRLRVSVRKTPRAEG